MFESLTDRLTGIFDNLRGKGRLTEDDINSAMREIRLALLEADVNFKVVKNFINNTKERCLTAEVLDSLTPAQNVTKVVLEELTNLLDQGDAKFQLGAKTPHVIMLVGLQGSGKTTACAKLAYKLKQQNHTPLLVACDTYRPAAADQLESLGNDMDVAVYRQSDKTPVQIAREGVQYAIDNLKDVVIIDTAGRLHVDEQMMDEAKNIKDATSPDQTMMVVDAMTGQDAVNVANSFAEQVEFDGVIMSKMDGDARGGGALSIMQVTGKPILFISSGEKPDSLDEFHPDRMAKRILGMGDMVSLIESAVAQEQAEIEEEQAERMLQAKLTLDDFITFNQQIGKMGGMGKIMESMPNANKTQVDEHALDDMVVIIHSMTKEERQKPEILNGSRRARIAAGAGVRVQDVNQLIQRFNQTRKMLKKIIPNFEEVPEYTGKNRRRKKGNKKKKNKRRSMMGIPGLENMGLGDMRKLSKQIQEMQKNGKL
ncbi:MAG: signal recognition particle protein [Coriobacteriia bacterium]|nr:signal recognition particle protein [Coriobacteriia bacterium]